jgi:hypothetical protein
VGAAVGFIDRHLPDCRLDSTFAVQRFDTGHPAAQPFKIRSDDKRQAAVFDIAKMAFECRYQPLFYVAIGDERLHGGIEPFDVVGHFHSSVILVGTTATSQRGVLRLGSLAFLKPAGGPAFFILIYSFGIRYLRMFLITNFGNHAQL